MKKLTINIPDKEYYDCVSGEVVDLYDFSKTMLKAVAAGELEDPEIEVGDIVIKSGGVYGEIYGIVTYKDGVLCTVMFNNGHTINVTKDALHPTGFNYKDLLDKVLECIQEWRTIECKI